MAEQLPAVAAAAAPAPSAAGGAPLLTSWTRLPARQTLSVGIILAAVIAAAIGAWLWAQQPDYRVLYSNLSDRGGERAGHDDGKGQSLPRGETRPARKGHAGSGCRGGSEVRRGGRQLCGFGHVS